MTHPGQTLDAITIAMAEYADRALGGDPRAIGAGVFELVGMALPASKVKYVDKVGDVSRGARHAPVYSVAFETTIPKTGIGTRASHIASANRNLAEVMKSDLDLANAMQRLGVKMPERLDQSPSGWTWHHVPGQPGVMQLVPRAQHQGAPWQSVLHPGQVGGFKLWGSDF